ncbi:MAG: flagellar basal body P-ring formation chaperone FlgA [Halanaerobiales bacterium]
MNIKNRYNLSILFIIVFLVLALLIVGTEIEAETPIIQIKIEREAEVNQSVIYLGSIADIEGGSNEQIRELNSLILGDSVLPGYSKDIYRNQIILQIEDLGFDMSDILLDMPARVTVYTASIVLDGDDLAAEGRYFLQGYLDYPLEDLEIDIKYKPSDITIPDQDYRIQFEPSNFNNRNIGTLTLQAKIIVNDELYRKAYIRYDVSLYKAVYIAQRTVYDGEKINEGDFNKERRIVDSSRGTIISDMNDSLVRDGIVRYQIPAGSILTSYYLEKPYLIRRGDEVQAEVIIGNIRVITSVKSRQRGKKGDYITVENNKTGHRFQAQVISAHLVRLVQ